ncbi:MAG: PAS-domain containing protein [Alphaproteobacteria bacterium]
MPTALIGIAIGDVAIALAMVGLFTARRPTNGLRWWAGAFVVDAARKMTFLLVPVVGAGASAFAAETLQATAAVLILGGILIHLGRPMSRIFLAACIAGAAAWAVASRPLGLGEIAGHLPSTILIFVAAGVCLHQLRQKSCPVLPAVTVALVLIGVQRLVHPLAMSSGSYAAWYFIAVFGFNLLLAFSFIMLVQRREWQSLRDARDSLALSQNRLRASEERFRDVAESSSDWVWEMDAKLRFSYFSDRFAKVTGLDPAKLIGKARRIVADLDDKAGQDHLRTLEAREPYRDFQYKTVAINGASRYFRISGKPIFDKKGQFTGYRGMGSEVTAEVEADTKLDQAREIINTALGALGEGFALFDPRDRLVTCNKTFRDCYPRLGRAIRRGVSFEKLALAMAEHGQVRGARRRKKAWLKERLAAHAEPRDAFEEQLADGRWLRVDETKVADGSTAITLVDITSLKRRQEASVLLAGADRDGADFLGTAALAVAVGLGYRWAGVCTHSADGKRAKMIALSDNGKIVQGPAYDLANTPCEDVGGERYFFVPDNITEAYPKGEILIEWGARSYQGQLILDRSGNKIGHLFACHDKPDPSSLGDPELMSLVAQWIGVEFERRATDAALKESEKRLRDFAEASSDWFWEMDAEMRFSRLTRGRGGQTRGPAKSILGKGPESLLPKGGEDDPVWKKHLKILEARKPFRNFVLERVDARGRTRYATIDGRPIFDADKRFIGYRGTGTDITAQVEAQQQAKQARGQLFDAIESMQEGFVLYDKDNRLVVCNAKYREFFFANDTDYVKPGMQIEEIVRVWAKENIKNSGKGGSEAWAKARMARHENPGKPFERRMTDGRILLTREYKTRDGGTVGVHADVTEQRRVQARLADAIESIPAGFLICDADDKIVMNNSSFGKWMMNNSQVKLADGMRFEDYLDRLIERGLAGDAARNPAKWRKQRLKAHRNPDKPVETRFADGRIIQVIERKTSDGGTVSVFIDITEQKNHERKLEQAQATLQTVLDTVDQGISMFDADLKLVAFNDRLRVLQGLPPRRFKLGDPFEKFIRHFAERGEYGEGDIDRMVDDRVALAKKFAAHKFERVRPDGQIIEIQGKPVPGGGGFVTTYTDVTERRSAEHELRESEERIRGVLDNVADGVITIDEEGKIESFNPAAESMFGYSAKAAIGQPVTILMTGADKTDHQKYIAKYRTTNKPSILGIGPREVIGCRKDGSTFPISLAVSKVKIGERRLFIGSVRDVTERKNHEAELEKIRTDLQMVLDNVDQGISMIDANMVNTVFNDKFLELLEFPKNKFKPGNTFEKFIRFNAERGEYGEGDVDEQVEERVELARKFEPHSFERQRPDGRCLEIRGKPIPGGGGFVTTYTDVTERNRADEALRTSEERYALAMEGAGEGLWDWDIDKDTVYLSRRLREFFGREETGQEVRSSSWVDRIHTEDIGRYRNCLVSHIKGEIDQFECEFRMLNAAGEYRWVLDRGIALHDDDGHAYRMAGSVHDITERKRAEQETRDAKDMAEAANITKGRFLATMSHELRTPLNAIIGFSEMMTSELFGTLGNPHYIEYARDIHESGIHLLNLINDILDVSKLEAGKIEIIDNDCQVGEVIAAVGLFVRERALEGDVEIEFADVSALPPLRADERRLKQILINLLSNAVKFTPAGGKVTVSARADAALGFIIEVRDTGIGIAPEDIPKALEPFAQIDSTLSRRYEGTGLGLPLTKSLIELHGGTISIESALGEGTLITVTFPPERIVRQRASG